MENNFEDLKKLWQNQRPVEFELTKLVKGLRETASKQQRERIAMLIITPVTIGFLFYTMPFRESRAILISLCLIAVAMLWVVWLTFSSRLRPVDSSEQFANKDYLEIQIQKLTYRYKIARKHMYGYAFLLAVALNISYFVLLEPLHWLIRVGIHLVLTCSIFAFMHWSIRRRVKKYDKELKPMITSLENILKESQESN